MTEQTDHFKSPPRRRKGALWLILSESARVLLVQKERQIVRRDPYPWGLPGGSAEGNELLLKAATRQLRRETGLKRTPGRILVFDEVVANAATGSFEGDNYVIHGGIVPRDTEIELSGDLTNYKFVLREELRLYLSEHQAGRVENAMDALDAGGFRHLVMGKVAE